MEILKILCILAVNYLCSCSGQNLNKKSEDVRYFLCTRNKTLHPIDLNSSSYDLNKELPVKVMIHGFTENVTTQWYKEITDAYLRKNDYNLILVDWSKKANLTYVEAVRSTNSVGNLIGDFLINLVATEVIHLDNIHVVAHSLGGHVAGFAGKRIFKVTQNKVSRITGLDPAGPLFEIPPRSPEFRLSKEDAEFVDVIHTDGGFLGFKASIGHADFFPNGGTAFQPGCIKTQLKNIKEYFCSHQKSHQYFIESINSKMSAKPCNSWELYKSGACDKNKSVPFGDDTSSKFLGNFYLRINAKPPYAAK